MIWNGDKMMKQANTIFFKQNAIIINYIARIP